MKAKFFLAIIFLCNSIHIKSANPKTQYVYPPVVLHDDAAYEHGDTYFYFENNPKLSPRALQALARKEKENGENGRSITPGLMTKERRDLIMQRMAASAHKDMPAQIRGVADVALKEFTKKKEKINDDRLKKIHPRISKFLDGFKLQGTLLFPSSPKKYDRQKFIRDTEFDLYQLSILGVISSSDIHLIEAHEIYIEIEES